MSDEIRSLRPLQEKAPALWTMFTDATGGMSYTRIVGFIVMVIFFSVWAYLSLSTGTMIVPPKEMVYILVAFAAAKPVQRFAETKDNENQLNYDFQMAQLDDAMAKIPVTKPVDKTE